MLDEKLNLLNYSTEMLKTLFSEIGEKPFRAVQVIKWIHQRGVTDFDEMTNLSKSLREKLKEIAVIQVPKVILDKPSKDGTRKWLIQMKGGSCIETVYIPEGDRGTLCISSQIGCILNCSFCSTGKQGFNRNLDVFEVIGQLWIAARNLSQNNGDHDGKVTNIVMMGMGEPLLNYDNLIPSLSLMMDDNAYGLSKRRVTVSTSGIVPKMYELLEDTDVSLAVSLHACNDELRNILVPVNKKYSLKELLAACKLYAEKGPQKSLTFEYTLMDGINDTLEHAVEMVKVLRDIPCKINLIPFNPYPGSNYKKPSNNRIHRFKDYLVEHNYIATIRRTRGDDIDAACGQLVGSVKDRTKRSERYKKSLENNLT